MPKDEPNINLSSEIFKDELKHVVSKLRELVENDYKIGQLLFENRSYLDPDKLGSLLGNKSNKQILQGYISQFNLEGAELGAALKDFLENGGFNLPQEHDMINAILFYFAKEFVEKNPDNAFSSNSDDIAALLYGVLLLNVDLTSNNFTQKITEKEFVNNMMQIGNLNTLHDELKIKEKKLSSLMSKKSKDRDQKEEVESLLIDYQDREKQIKHAKSNLKAIYQFIQQSPIEIELSKTLKKEKHHKKIPRTLSLLFPIKHFKRVMVRPKHTNKELHKGSRPKND